MFSFIMLFIFIAGFAFGEPWVSIIPGIYLAFKLTLVILQEISDRNKMKAGYKKQTRRIHHKYTSDWYGTHEVDEERTEWVKKK